MNVMRRAWLLTVFTALSFPVYAQFLPDLQAKTPEEYDAYLDVLDGPVLEKGAVFENAFPSSTLLLPVCELMAREWRSQGNAEKAIAAVERGLAVAPDYVPLLVELGDLLANGSARLDAAAAAARRALSLLETAHAPRRISAEQWTAAVSRLRARARGAIGTVLFKQDDLAGAIKEYEAALAEPMTPEPSLQYRLGRLYAITGRKSEARVQLQDAARRGDKIIRERANAALAELR